MLQEVSRASQAFRAGCLGRSKFPKRAMRMLSRCSCRKPDRRTRYLGTRYRKLLQKLSLIQSLIYSTLQGYRPWVGFLTGPTSLR